jgi:hypothetical protein
MEWMAGMAWHHGKEWKGGASIYININAWNGMDMDME